MCVSRIVGGSWGREDAIAIRGRGILCLLLALMRPRELEAIADGTEQESRSAGGEPPLA